MLRHVGLLRDGGTVRTVTSVLAATLGAVTGAVAGLVASILLWLALPGGDGPEVPIGALLALARLAVPIGLIVGGVVGWQLSRGRAS